jgi:hypothetical protein
MNRRQLLGMLALPAYLFSQAQTISDVGIDLTRQLLVNPDFEVYALNGELRAYDADTYANALGQPYGWQQSPAAYDGISRGLSQKANNYSGNSLCFYNQTTFPMGFMIYQTIPAARLGAGIYKVSCLMWVEKDKYGAACLYANHHVEYWSTSNYYTDKNLTPGDTQVTYAGYAGGDNTIGNVNLRPMTVYVTLADGDDLTLGVRTGSNDYITGQPAASNGWFKVDDFHVERVTAVPDLALTDPALVNPGFELDYNGNPYATPSGTGVWNAYSSGVTPTHPFYGWTVPYYSDNCGITSNGLNLEGKYNVWFNAKTTPLSDDFSLTQTVGADLLTPGVYEVSCRLWQPSDATFGTCRLYATNGTATHVQYYAKPTDYGRNLTSGEEATYAGYSGYTDNSSSRRVNEMFLNIPVTEGQSLTLGIKSGQKTADGSDGGVYYGQFHADAFRLSRVSNLLLVLHADAENSLVQQNRLRVTLPHTFVDGEWHTLCLPFSLSAADIRRIFGPGTVVAAFQRVEGTVLSFSTTADICAGVPYLIKTTNVLPSPLTLDDVAITSVTPQAVFSENIIWQGLYSPFTLQSGDASRLYLSGNRMVPAEQSITLPAFGAYAVSTTPSDGYTIQVDGISTGVTTIDIPTASAPVYNLSGQRISSRTRGLQLQKGRKLFKR